MEKPKASLEELLKAAQELIRATSLVSKNEVYIPQGLTDRLDELCGAAESGLIHEFAQDHPLAVEVQKTIGSLKRVLVQRVIRWKGNLDDAAAELRVSVVILKEWMREYGIDEKGRSLD